MSNSRLRRLTCLADGSKLTTAEFRGVTYDVIPIMAMRENIVIRPMGSTTGEFVPSDILAASLHKISNSPVVLNHPADSNGDSISANTVDTLEAAQIGYNFEPEYNEGWLIKVYLSDDLAATVDTARGDTEASNALSDLRAGKSREVSVGVYAYIENIDGTAPNGDSYGAVWLGIDHFDHLAILDSSSIGACSNSDGCGLVASSAGAGPNMLGMGDSEVEELKYALESVRAPGHAVMRAGNRREVSMIANGKLNKWARRAQISLRNALLNGELSDGELREKLFGALAADGENVDWIPRNGVYPKQQVVIYETWEDGNWQTWQRKFKLTDNIAELKGDRVEVLGFAPVIKDAAGIETSVDIELEAENKTTGGVAMAELEVSKEVRAAVDLIVNCDRCPFGADDIEHLSTKSEGWLKDLLGGFAGGTVPDSTPAPVPAPADGEVVISVEELNSLRSDLADMKPAADAYKRAAETRRGAMIRDINAVDPRLDDAFFKGMSDNRVALLHSTTHGRRDEADYSLALGASGAGSAPERKAIPTGLTILNRSKAN